MSSNQSLTTVETFIQDNAYGIYQYMNEVMFKDIGILNPNYFVKIFTNVFNENADALKQLDTTNKNLLPYQVLTLLFGTGTIAYTSLRTESLDLAMLNAEAKKYYNYIQFSLEDDNTLVLKLMQSKIGGMPIDADIVKYSKLIPTNTTTLIDFISSYKIDENSDEYLLVTEGIKKIFKN